jgi:hypothetical protein
MRLEGAARERQDAGTADMFGEISEMLLGMAGNTSSPLLELVVERLPSHPVGRSQEYKWRRIWSLHMVLFFMETHGMTRYAACLETSRMLNGNEGKKKITSGAKELAKHLPASLDGFYETYEGKEVIMTRDVCRAILRAELGREPNHDEVFLLGVEALQDWKNATDTRADRIAKLRAAIGDPVGRSMKDVALTVDGLLDAAAKVGTITPIVSS